MQKYQAATGWLPSISNFHVDTSGIGYVDLMWGESNDVAERWVTTDSVIGSAVVTNLTAGSCTVTGSANIEYNINLYLTNSYGRVTQQITTTMPFPVPTITNLYSHNGSFLGGDLGNVTLTWDETNVTSRSATVVTLVGGYSAGIVTDLVAGSCTLTGTSDFSNANSYEVTITVSNAYTSVSAAVSTGVPCFLGFVKLQTRGGPVAAEDVTLGMEMLQPDGSYSKIVKTASRVVTEFTRPADARLFADPSEKMVVTSWHKIRFSDETTEQKADEHPRLHEVFREMPFLVYHFHLEHYTHKILIHDTDIIAESFVPVNPA